MPPSSLLPCRVADSIRRQQRQDEAAYQPAAAQAPAPQPKPVAGAAGGRAGAGMRKGADGDVLPAVEAIKAWLGPLWRPECAEMDLAELALQASCQGSLLIGC